MLPSASSREFFACPSSPWNLPSFTVESTLSSPCSRSNSPLSCQGAALAHLHCLLSHDLVIWSDGSVPFRFGKCGSGVLANCSFCGTEATLSFSAGPICSSFSAEACAILQALRWSRQHQQVYYFSFLLSPFCPPLRVSSYPKFSSRNCVLFSPVLSGYSGSPYTRFSRGTMRLMSLSDGNATRALCNPL